jgi:hypothetical protein
MVASGTDAGAKYEAAIKLLGGSSAYRACGAKGKVKDVAECMHGLKAKLTESDWAAKYRFAYG